MIPVEQVDVENRLRRALTSDESEYLDALVDEASALVEGYLGVEYPTGATAPAAVVVVASRVVARLFLLPDGVAALADTRTASMGPLSATIQYATDSSSGGPWLTKSDRMALAPYRARGAISVPLVREVAPAVTWGS